MSFLWPLGLLAVLLVPLGVLVWRAIDRRRRAAAGALGGRGMAPTTTRRRRWRGPIPALLFVAGFTVLAFSLARPQAAVSLPREEGTVILAFDVSASMAADDLKPTRMDAAKAAATAFVQSQPPGVVIGVVAFSDAGLSVQAPTSDQGAILAAIERINPSRGTSVGQGITAALSAIDQSEADTPANYYSNRSPEPTATPAPVAPGSHGSAVVILLSDGENNESPDPIAVAQAAADRGIRIDTVGIGTAAGTTITLGGFQVHTQLDEATLQQVASITGGTYHDATSADDLLQVYRDLDTRLVVKSEPIEVTALFAGAAILLFVVGGILSLAWAGRLP